jgi:hypothetical protein
MGKRRRAKRSCETSDAPASVERPLPVPPPEIDESNKSPEQAQEEREQTERDDAIYCKHRDDMNKLAQEAATEFDKALLTLAGVAFAFSIGFVKDVIRPTGAALQWPILLYASWCLFFVPIALITFNLQVSYSAAKKFGEILDRRWRTYKPTNEKFWDEVDAEMNGLTRNKAIECFNWISLFSFLLGIASLIGFVVTNTVGEQNERKIQQSATASAATAPAVGDTGDPTGVAPASRDPGQAGHTKHRDAAHATRTDANTETRSSPSTTSTTQERDVNLMAKKIRQPDGGDQQRTYVPHTPRVTPQTTPQQRPQTTPSQPQTQPQQQPRK